MPSLTLETTVTCPACGHGIAAAMPTNACVQRLPCPSCSHVVTPAKGDCCVFCSHGAHACPPVQGEAPA